MDKKSVTYPKEEKIQLPLGVRGAKAAALFSEKVKNSSPKSLSAYCRPTVGSIPTVNRQLSDCRPTVGQQSADSFLGELFFTFSLFSIFSTDKQILFAKQVFEFQDHCVIEFYAQYCRNCRSFLSRRLDLC